MGYWRKKYCMKSDEFIEGLIAGIAENYEANLLWAEEHEIEYLTLEELIKEIKEDIGYIGKEG